MPNPTSKLNLVINGTTTQLDIHDANAVDLTNNQTVAGNKEFTGTTTAHDLVPSATDTYNFGSPSVQWNNAYIKSLTINGVACGDILTHNVSEFVGVSSNQTINGSKYFTSLLSKSNTLARGSLPTTNINEDPIFISIDKNNRRALAFFNYYNTNGDGRVVLYAYNQNTTNFDNIGLAFGFDNTNNSKSIYPVITNACNLGAATNKWKSFNGINPGALSLWSNNYISLDTTGFDVTSTTIGTFTPTVDGWATLVIGQKNKPFGIWLIGGAIRESFYSVKNNDDYFIFALIPVRANVNMTIYCTADDIDSTRNVSWLRLSPCQGNV